MDITVSWEEYNQGLDRMCLLTSMKAEDRSIMYSWPMSGKVFLSILLNPSDDLSYLNHARVLLFGRDAGVFVNVYHWTFPHRYGICQRVRRFCCQVLCAGLFRQVSQVCSKPGMTYAFWLTEPCTKIVKIKNCLEARLDEVFTQITNLNLRQSHINHD